VLQLKQDKVARIFVLIFVTGSPALASVLCATVMDFARLPLPSASLNATNLLTAKAYVTRSDKNGTGCFSDIPEGLYSIEASLVGFLHVKYYPVRITSSAKERLSFWLPFSEITEGGLDHESTLSGTLLSGGSPLESAEVCVIGVAGAPRTCMVTNDLGEYALVVTSGQYQTEVRTREGKVYKSKLDVSIPGIYRNRLSLVRSRSLTILLMVTRVSRRRRCWGPGGRRPRWTGLDGLPGHSQADDAGRGPSL
jgi:hypothetical protein